MLELYLEAWRYGTLWNVGISFCKPPMACHANFKQKQTEYKVQLQRCSNKKEQKEFLEHRRDGQCCKGQEPYTSPYEHIPHCDKRQLDVSDLNDCVTTLALRLMKEFTKKRESFVFSPISIACLLSMACEGATGKTKKEIDQKVFHGVTDLPCKMGKLTQIQSTYKFLLESQDRNMGYYDLLKHGMETTEKKEEPYLHLFQRMEYTQRIKTKFHKAAHLYNDCDEMNQNDPLKDPCWFLVNVESYCHFDNGCFETPLRDEGRLLKFEENDPENPTNIYLVNWSALKFKCGENHWSANATPCVGIETKENASGQRLAPQMTLNCKVGQAAVENIGVTRIYFPEETRSLILLHPTEQGIEKMVNQLDQAKMKQILNDSMNSTEKSVILPHCRLDSAGNLNNILTTLGCGAMFGPGKDFTEILDGHKFAAGAAVHKAYIDLNLERPRCGAAAAVVYGDRPVYQPPLVHTRWIVEQPFAFFLLDETYDTIQACGCFAVLLEGQREPVLTERQESGLHARLKPDDELAGTATGEAENKHTVQDKTRRRSRGGARWNKWKICRRRAKKR